MPDEDEYLCGNCGRVVRPSPRAVWVQSLVDDGRAFCDDRCLEEYERPVRIEYDPERRVIDGRFIEGGDVD